MPQQPLNEILTERYDRQIRLSQIGLEGQTTLANSHALIIGLGGLGSPASLYLAASGIGTLTLVDFDVVEASNLQRQIIHREATVGISKVESAKQTLLEVNPHITINAINAFLSPEQLLALCQQADVVVDCTDNGFSRTAINEAAMIAKKPLVSAAAIRWEGQLSVFDGRDLNAPCYLCFDPQANQGGETCDAQGIVAPVVGTLGVMQALETLKVLLGNASLIGEVLLFDGLTMNQRRFKLTQDPDCPVCAVRKQRNSH
jgi:adenylyltransferase/sulfurtransferase